MILRAMKTPVLTTDVFLGIEILAFVLLIFTQGYFLHWFLEREWEGGREEEGSRERETLM